MLAAILLASSWMYVVMGHVNTLDMGLSFFLTATVGAFLFAQQCPTDSSSQRNWMLTAWAAAALAFLTKGLVALVLPSLTLSAYSVVTQNWSIWRRLHLRFGIVVFVAISAPWFIAVSSSNS
jgi:4-amino-4-deoxy-L-arabinose transferase-like glycosyltransferase